MSKPSTYELDLPVSAELRPGTNVLVTGPSMTGKRSLLLDALITGIRREENAMMVTTNVSAAQLLDAYERQLDSLDRSLVGIVDCSTKQNGTDERVEKDDRIATISSPGDLTGIGMQASQLLQHLLAREDDRRVRLGFHSLSTLLMYADPDTVFKFLHVLTDRVHSAGGLGLFVIDSTGHDERTISTIRQLFDGELRTRNNDGRREASLDGSLGGSSEWTAF